MGIINPFTQRDIALARQVVDSSNELLDYYKKCTSCGGNVAALVEQVKAHKNIAEGILREFAGGNESL